jgi:hypothetical protein
MLGAVWVHFHFNGKQMAARLGGPVLVGALVTAVASAVTEVMIAALMGWVTRFPSRCTS